MHDSEVKALAANTYNVLRGENTARRNGLRTAGCISGILAVISIILPFSDFLFDEYTARLSGFQLIYCNIRFSPELLIQIPTGLRICLILSLILSAAGIVLLLLGKYMYSSLAFFGAAVSTVIEITFIASVTQEATRAGISTTSGSMLYGWTLLLFLTLLSAVLVLAITGLEKSAETIFKLSASLSIGIVVIITLYMFIYGSPALFEIGIGKFIFGTQWQPTASTPQFGILYMILASLFGCIGAIAIGVPIGLMTAVFLAEIAPKWVKSMVRPAVELLAGIPSVIFGFWGMKVLVPFIRTVFTKLGFSTTGSGLLAVILILSIMILPTIISVAETALKSVPPAYTEASLALGNTKISTIFAVQIPAARSGILAGVILGVGRAIGETMAVIMVAGNIVELPGLLSSVRPMTAGIAFEMGYAEAGLHRQSLFAIGLVLFVFIMLVNITFTFISKRGVQMDAK